MNYYMMVLSVLFLIAGTVVSARELASLRNSKAYPGSVIGIDTSPQGRSKRSSPIVEFIDETGIKRTFTSSVASLNCKSGDRVWVAANLSGGKPSLLSLGDIFLLPTVLFLFGLVLAFIVTPMETSSRLALQTVGFLLRK